MTNALRAPRIISVTHPLLHQHPGSHYHRPQHAVSLVPTPGLVGRDMRQPAVAHPGSNTLLVILRHAYRYIDEIQTKVDPDHHASVKVPLQLAPAQLPGAGVQPGTQDFTRLGHGDQ